jgi:hypothetical protein
MGDGYGGQILEYPVLCVQISVVYYSLVVLVSESTREFFATPVDVKETNWQRCVCRKLILILKRVASSSMASHTNPTK